MKKLDVIGIIAGAVGIGANVIAGAVKNKKQEQQIEDAVNKALLEKLNERKES